jgi:hypothetical protein
MDIITILGRVAGACLAALLVAGLTYFVVNLEPCGLKGSTLCQLRSGVTFAKL